MFILTILHTVAASAEPDGAVPQYEYGYTKSCLRSFINDTPIPFTVNEPNIAVDPVIVKLPVITALPVNGKGETYPDR